MSELTKIIQIKGYPKLSYEFNLQKIKLRYIYFHFEFEFKLKSIFLVNPSLITSSLASD